MIGDVVSAIARLHQRDLYRVVRPSEQSESDLQLWLLRHDDGGWVMANEKVRREAARRLLAVLWAVEHGRLGKDDR